MGNSYYGVVASVDNECYQLSLDELPNIEACKKWLVKNKPCTNRKLFFTQYRRDTAGLVFAVCDYDLNGKLEFEY